MFPYPEYNWDQTPYANEKESLPTNISLPLTKRIMLTHYFHANPMYDVLSGKVVTGYFHLVNKTQIMLYSTKQAKSETATYGSEFIACRICCEKVIDLHCSFNYLGVRVYHKSYTFNDNDAQITRV